MLRSIRAVMLALVACAACGGNQASRVDLTLVFDESVSDETLASVKELTFVASGDEHGSYDLPLNRAAQRTERLFYAPLSSTRTLTLTVTAWSGGGASLASGVVGPLALTSGSVRTAEVTLEGAPLPDGGDLADDAGTDGGQDTCADATQDGDETGIDCGGSCPTGCIGAICSSGGQCVTGVCDVVCVPASGPPAWLDGPSLTAARSYTQAAQRDDGTLVVIGGTANGMPAGVLASVEILTTTGFVAGTDLTTARLQHAVASDAAGRIYAIDGRNATNGSVNSVEVLNGATWTTVQATLGSHSLFGAARVDANRILLTDSGPGEIYSVSANAWTASANATVEREASATVFITNDTTYEIGGHTTTQVNNVDVYNGTTNLWSARSPLTVARQNLAGVLAGDGRVYAIGGLAASTLTTVEAYLPAANRWTSMVAQLPAARQAMAAGLGPDGRMYIVGGIDGAGTTLATSLAYGPTIVLSPASASPGALVTVTVGNLAASAATSVSFDSTRVGVAQSSASGAITVKFEVPSSAASGAHTIKVVDARSQFPVSAAFSVP